MYVPWLLSDPPPAVLGRSFCRGLHGGRDLPIPSWGQHAGRNPPENTERLRDCWVCGKRKSPPVLPAGLEDLGRVFPLMASHVATGIARLLRGDILRRFAGEMISTICYRQNILQGLYIFCKKLKRIRYLLGFALIKNP